MRLTQIIEALLFASDAPLSAADLARVDERLDEDTVQAVIEELRAEYDAAERSFSIYEVAGGYQLLTRPEFISVLERYETVPQPSRLSSPALEVLAVIAYRQPIGRAEVEDIRGVSSSGVLKTLQDRGLVEAVGRAEGLGRPLLYGTTSKFLEHFGFRSLEDLPRPDELPVVLRARTLDGSAPETMPEEAAPAEPEAVAAPEPTPEELIDREAETIAAAVVLDDPDAAQPLLEPEPPAELEAFAQALPLDADGAASAPDAADVDTLVIGPDFATDGEPAEAELEGGERTV